ncbi:hypothetical protein OJAV_G00095350 [Oryzias javanicus]|uniref:receptor protein-tyrosine kinase n=1 Tax=Oryzias javanicus TaxID=123683 RepID=A0A3S2MX75_ORYJA|nr:hypothetical protein OJAV_G00095350 [Oryzias javanicus]
MLLFLLLILQTSAAVGQIDPGHCRFPLGLEDGRVKDEDISASSEWYQTTGPQFARLNREDGDGAWCPEGQLEHSDSQFLQVDLKVLTFLTLVGTQGRYARGLGKEFARAYRLGYSRDGLTWKAWKNRQGNAVIEGNKNTYAIVYKELHPSIVARYVRLIPVTEQSSTVCMRVELYGCPWHDGLISYSAPEGQLMMPPGYPPASLNDSIYDGTHERRPLFGGLGQLTDGVVGQDDFLLTHEKQVWSGYDYLGWRNDSLGTQGYVEMEFVFDRQRNFTSMKVHSNNLFTRGVKIFSSVSCWFKPRLIANWELEAVTFRTVLDDRNPSARYVTRDLLPVRKGRHSVTQTTTVGTLSTKGDQPNRTSDHNSSTAEPHTAAAPSANDTTEGTNTPILIGCLVTIILLLVVIIFLILWCQCVCKVLEKAPRQISDEEVTIRLSSCSDTIIMQTPPVPPRAGHAPTGPASTDPHYERVFLLNPPYQNPAVLRNKLPELPQSAEASACGGGYAEPDVTQCTPHQSFHSNAPHYAETDIIRLQGVTGSNMYAVPALTVDSLTRKDISAAEFPRQQLIFREKLGEGQFGEVHLCEAEGLPEFLGEGSPLPDRDGRPVLVAVKQLRADATLQARNDFLKEIKIMSRLDDPNIIRLLCVCVSSDPLCMVTEYMENGDLNMFLSQREIESTLTHANSIPSVSLSDLLHMAVQISSGMKYLASLNFVHRDLATRNCLVDRRLTIKIADFGMSRNLYSSDYYRIQGRAVLPIRWMAWESILLGKFTTASDVWAFGAALQPAVRRTGHREHWRVLQEPGQTDLPLQPPPLPPSLFDLMMHCWSRNITDRPAFDGIHQSLRRHVRE